MQFSRFPRLILVWLMVTALLGNAGSPIVAAACSTSRGVGTIAVRAATPTGVAIAEAAGVREACPMGMGESCCCEPAGQRIHEASGTRDSFMPSPCPCEIRAPLAPEPATFEKIVVVRADDAIAEVPPSAGYQFAADLSDRIFFFANSPPARILPSGTSSRAPPAR